MGFLKKTALLGQMHQVLCYHKFMIARFCVRFAGNSAVLAEISTSTAEFSKRLVNFCSPKSSFSSKVSGIGGSAEEVGKWDAASIKAVKRFFQRISHLSAVQTGFSS